MTIRNSHQFLIPDDNTEFPSVLNSPSEWSVKNEEVNTSTETDESSGYKEFLNISAAKSTDSSEVGYTEFLNLINHDKDDTKAGIVDTGEGEKKITPDSSKTSLDDSEWTEVSEAFGEMETSVENDNDCLCFWSPLLSLFGGGNQNQSAAVVPISSGASE